jgi:uncharacterized integral membrane protein
VRLRRPHVDGDELRESFPPRVLLRLIGLSVLVAYLVAFVLENAHAVHVHFVIATKRVSLIWVIVLSLALGVLTGLALPGLYRYRRRNRSQPRDPV